jgi:hypothetical protein
MTHRPNLIKQNIGLDKAKYEIVRNSILKNLFAYGAMTSEQLAVRVKDHLNSKSEGSLWGYYHLVKQELEIRGEIRCVPNTEPPRIEIAA